VERPARDVEWVAELLGPAGEVGRANDHAKRHSFELHPTPVHDARDDRDHLVHAGDPRRAGRSRQHLQRGDHASSEERVEILRRVERLATAQRASRAGRQSSCHEMQVLAGYRSDSPARQLVAAVTSKTE